MSFSTSPLDFSCGLGLGLWLEVLFTAAELAAADQLVQLSGGGGDEASSSATSSPRSVNTCCTATAAAVEEEQVEEMMGPGMELDGRARKRYRLVSELYAATRPVRGGAAGKKWKRYNDESEAEMMRYGESETATR